jgi:glucan phosphoethanolaminetransferase (alkaline phosphatase superfamily)
LGEVSVRNNLIKAIALASFFLFANNGFTDVSKMLLERNRVRDLFVYLALWGIALLAVAIAAWQPNRFVRWFWALLIAGPSAVAYAYFAVSRTELSIWDIFNLWNARYEAGRAFETYGAVAVPALAIFVFGFLAIAWPGRLSLRYSKWLNRASVFPLVPLVLIGALVQIRKAEGVDAMPWQFNTLALSLLVTEKNLFAGETVGHQPVTIEPVKLAQKPNILMLMDESIRADYLEFSLDSSNTPQFARFAQAFANFGPAISAGVCSNSSNALLRFAASRKDIQHSARNGPYLFAYAKKAGYRTVFIDAQARLLSGYNELQNYMSIAEKANIDGFYPIKDGVAYDGDYNLLKILQKELSGPEPVFIYANKNGAHFPYDKAYPLEEAHYHPTITEGGDNTADRVASYRNAIAWSVDGFFAEFSKTIDMKNLDMIYTSDHGQRMRPGSITHCQGKNPDPETALVPMIAYTADASKMADLRLASQTSHGRNSHYQIAPTLLSWMGYTPQDLASLYDESLTITPTQKAGFLYRDVFGLFGSKPNWISVDETVDYMEPEGKLSKRTN